MVEAIEDCFIPVLVYNNIESDASLLKSFDEPSWNNPVVRFLNKDGKDVIPRKDRVWSTGPLAARMVESLQASGRDLPRYLDLIGSASNPEMKRASFAML